jgi:protein-tyrosine phosphatase
VLRFSFSSKGLASLTPQFSLKCHLSDVRFYPGGWDLIDLHSHILPGVDDGAQTIEDAIAIARMAVADGIEVMACTPHFMPGLYNNSGRDIRARVAQLNELLVSEGIDLALVVGGDAHIRPDFVNAMRSGDILSLHDSRYVLFEPPHVSMPQRFEELLFNVQMAGYVPILTHPERFKWIENNYEIFQNLARGGVWMQLTAGSLTGRFGKRSRYWAQKMLGEGLVSIIATDTHNVTSRPPLLAEARAAAETEVGLDEARHLVVTRPSCVLENAPAEAVPPLLVEGVVKVEQGPFWRRIFGR